MKNRFLQALVLLSLGTGPASAGDAPGIEWLAGHWCAEVDGAVIEELWLAPVGGTMIGINRTSDAGRMTAFEFLRIAEHEGKRAYLAQPGGRPLTAFSVAEERENYIAFENPAHDFPQRIEYRREDDALHARVSGADESGRVSAFDFDFEICREG